MPLNMEKFAPDRSHDTECPLVAENGDKHSADTGIEGKVHDAAVKTLKCKKKKCKAMQYCNCWRGASA